MEEQACELLKHEPPSQLAKAEQKLEKLRSMYATQVELDGEKCPRAVLGLCFAAARFLAGPSALSLPEGRCGGACPTAAAAGVSTRYLRS